MSIVLYLPEFRPKTCAAQKTALAGAEQRRGDAAGAGAGFRGAAGVGHGPLLARPPPRLAAAAAAHQRHQRPLTSRLAPFSALYFDSIYTYYAKDDRYNIINWRVLFVLFDRIWSLVLKTENFSCRRRRSCF